SLNPEVVSSDVAGFEAAIRDKDARRAVELYRGPFLDGFYVSDAPAFEEWAERERSRLAQAYADALERLAGDAETAGEAEEAVRWWKQVAAHDPHSSRVALRLMRALEAAGDRVSAIRHAEIHVTMLREAYEMEPDPEVVALAARLRTSPPSPLPVAPQEPPRRTETPPPEPPAHAPGDDDGAPVPLPDARRPRRLARLAAILAAGLVVLATAVTWLRGDGPGVAPPTAANRIAVLYFENHSGDPVLGYLLDDLTESLIHQLAHVEGLYVVSPNGVRPFRGRAVSPDSLRRALDVGTLLDASLRRSGDSLRLTVHLVDANSGEELDGTVLVRPLGERFALGSDLAADVAEFLRARLGKEIRLREWTAGTRSDRARELLSRAEEMCEDGLEIAGQPDAVALQTTGRMLDIADSLLAQAGEIDPRWVEPSVRRGWLALHRIGATKAPQKRVWTREARKHAERALALDPAYAPALELRGTASWLEASAGSVPPEEWKALTARAEADLRAATAADPSLAGAWSTLSEVLRFKPDLVEAEFAARQAYEKDAYLRDVDQVLEQLYRITLMLERPAEARRWCDVGLRKFPGNWTFVQCRLAVLSHPSVERPDTAQALQLLRELSKIDPPEKARDAGRPYHPIYRMVRTAVVLARAGQEERARALLARAREEAGDDPALNLYLAYDEAYLRLVLGERERARDLLCHYVRTRGNFKAYALVDPQFRPLWSDPAFCR
ncbi:MAG TPA: BTAD domain-containing putative transcriptional regulator, partial [Longimicrobiaceae bacterium]